MSKRSGYLYNPYKPHFYDRVLDCCVFNFLEQYGSTEKTRSFLRHLPLNLLVFFSLIALFTFGPGYQPIAIAFLPALILLVAYTRSAPSWWHLVVVAYPAVTIGTFFAYAGTFVYEGNPWSSPDVLYSLLLSAIYGIVIMIVCLLDRIISNFSEALLPFVEIFFAFPFLWAGTWAFVGRVSPFGDFFNWGISLGLIGIDDLTVGVTWLFGAVPGGCFVMGMIVSCFLYSMRRYFEVCYPLEPVNEQQVSLTPPPLAKITDIRIPFLHPSLLCVYIMALIFGFGSFYQYPIANWAPETVRMSCLVNGTFASTITHMETTGLKSEFVIWSEKSVVVNDENEFLKEGLQLSKRYGKYLGLSYIVPLPAGGRYTEQNKFALLIPPRDNQSDATIGFIQQKVHPVPFIEAGSQPGPRTFQYVDTPYGRVGGAIGFDFDFATFGNTYYSDFAIMFQPAKTWGAIGEYHASMNRLRSVENGFTTFRCAQEGVSGVYDPFYRILTQQITVGTGDEFVYDVPVFGKRWTLVRFFLDYIGVMAMSILLFWIIFLGGWGILRIKRRASGKYQTHEPSVEMTEV